VQQAVQGQSAACAIGGMPPAVQHQSRAGDRVSREEVQTALEGFLRRAMQVQGGRVWWVTPEGRNAVTDLCIRDVGLLVVIEAWLNSLALPGDPAELAGEVTRHLPETIDHAWLERLKQMSGGGASTCYDDQASVQSPAGPCCIQEEQGSWSKNVSLVRVLNTGRYWRNSPRSLPRMQKC
jgi:hypothetical protein